MNIVDIVRKHVLERYYTDENTARMNMYDTHVKYVVDYALELANRLQCEREIVEISALLHDISRLDGSNENHHVDSAKYAEKILKKNGYDKTKIDKVIHCILTHRGGSSLPRNTLEANCLASADAMAHFRNISDMFYFVYHDLGVSSDMGKEMIKEKLEKSYNKILPEAKDIVEEKYLAAMRILE